MPPLLTARNLAKAYPSNVLFEGVSINVEDSERIGLIGPNGSGKSTLLKILAGMTPPDEGEVARKRGLKAVYVDQDDHFPEGATPFSVVHDSLDEHDETGMDRSAKASITLSSLGFEDTDQLVSTLSGGWRKRLSLARALAQDPELLLLDEPTNHLDLEGVLWLERFVKQVQIAILYITHDRRFLENTATRIIELSKAYPGGAFEASGNYSEFVRRKESFLDAQRAAQTAIASKVRRDTAWLNQGIQGRQTRNKTQVQAAAKRREELKDTIARNEAPSNTASFAFNATARQTNKLLTLDNVSKSMGDKRLFESLSITLTPGQRIGLLGVNGSGKTTLMRIMSGDLEPDSGKAKGADNLKTVTFSQHRDTLNPAHTLQEALCPYGETVQYHGQSIHVTGWARRFLFDPDQLSTPIKNLSGGEQARVLIANLTLLPADVLLLDEPTNDLDIPALEVLEQALMEFPGAIVLVTHDRFLLERISNEYLALNNKGDAKWFASIEQWNDAVRRSESAGSDTTDAPKPKSGSTKVKQPSSRGKLSYKFQLEFDGMEEAILKAESEVEELETQAADPELANDHKRVAVVYSELGDAKTHVANLYKRWAELESMIENG